MSDQPCVVIVGAGPAGALLGFLLARAGIRITLIERHADFEREFRGEGLTPSGQAMFREAGLWAQFDALPHTTFARANFYYKGGRVASVDLRRMNADFTPRFVSQPAMLDMLVREAGRFGWFHFERARVVDLETSADGVVGVQVDGGAGRHTIAADYVFATDGRFSICRRKAGLDQPKSPQFFDVVWCKLPMPEFAYEERAVRGYVGDGQLGLFIPSYDDRLQVGWVIEKGSYGDFREKGIEGWMEEIADHVSPDLAAHLRAHKHNTIRPFVLDVVCDHYERWSVPGMTLLGDAAHPMSPVGAQGINIALRDAVVAANYFVPLLKSGSDPNALDRAAHAFATERRKEVVPIQDLQARFPRFMLGSSVWLGIAASAVRAMSAVGLLGLAARLTGGRRHIFIHGATDVRLTVK